MTTRELVARKKSAFEGLTDWIGRKFDLKTVNGPWGALGLAPNFAGETVTPARAMQLSAVWRAVRLTASTIATLPLNFYRDTGNGPELVRGTPADNVCRKSPNINQTAVEFWEQIIACMEFLGNGYALKEMIGPRLVAMTVLHPGRMEPKRDRYSGLLKYHYTDDRGYLTIYDEDDILHLKGFSMGGDMGLSTVTMGAQTMGLAIAAERASGSLFKNGLRSAGFITTDSTFKEGDRPDIQENIDKYVGSANAGSVMILEGGMKYEKISMSSQDAELLLTRKFEIEEIGRWFDMPPILLLHAVDGQTMWGSGVEAIVSSWLTLGLTQRIKRIESAINKRVVSQRTDGDIYAKYNIDALLRADSAARAALYATYAQNGLRTRNEIRAYDELPPLPGGDELTVQVNLVPISQLGQNVVNSAVAAKTAFLAFLGIDTDEKPKPPVN